MGRLIDMHCINFSKATNRTRSILTYISSTLTNKGRLYTLYIGIAGNKSICCNDLCISLQVILLL